MFDSHLHTDFSTDSRMKIEEAIYISQNTGINLIITEHMDLKYPEENLFIFNPEDYFKEFSKYRNNNLLLGIELGMRPDCLDENRKIENSYNFDFVLGSVHIVNNMDLYYEDLYNNRSKKEAYSIYFKYMYDCVKSHSFIDSLGHIDYIARYARYDDQEIYYEEFSDLIDPILKLLAEMDKSIEINTRRFSNTLAVENLKKIYKRFRELGGNTVTIGSDSHSADSIGRGAKEAAEMAEACGLKIVYYKNRKPQYDK